MTLFTLGLLDPVAEVDLAAAGHNLLWVTTGNLIGGALFVALPYLALAFGEKRSLDPANTNADRGSHPAATEIVIQINSFDRLGGWWAGPRPAACQWRIRWSRDRSLCSVSVEPTPSDRRIVMPDCVR